jgi:hypothetical protein
LRTKVILAPYNDVVLQLNDDIVQRLDGPEEQYKSVDEAVLEPGQDPSLYPPEFLHSLTTNGLPPHVLKLKAGTIVMLLRNLPLKQGLCNGSRLIVKRMLRNLIECEFISGFRAGQHVLIPRVTLEPSGDLLPFTFKRHQFPIRPAFAMTINKAQGQTFDRVAVFLERPVFSHGQLYVAVSRARRFSSLFLKPPHGSHKTTNVVSKRDLA